MRSGGLWRGAFWMLLLAVAVGAGFYLGRREAPPREVSGKLLYERYCASCHGLEGKGDGPAASALQPPPPDLTRLQARLGGAYSVDQLMRAVDGRRTIRAHGTSAMPVWGEVFEQSLREGPYPRRITLLHIQALTEYLHTIQAEPTRR